MDILSSVYFLADVAASEAGETGAAIALPLVFVVGFVAAVSIGSIAWYNSKRPTGWEDKERPSIVPEVEKDPTPGLGTPES